MTDAELYAKIEAILGTPYKVGADGPEAFDCYGVARYVQGCLGISMPGIEREGDNYVALARKVLGHERRVEWVRVESPAHGDLMVMGNVDGRDFHIGVYLMVSNAAVCVHTDESAGVMIDDVIALAARGFHSFRYFRHYSLVVDV